MRRGLALTMAAALGFVIFALTTPPEPDAVSTPSPHLSPPLADIADSTSHPEFSLTGGALPNGTPFLVEVRPAVDDDVVGISGMLVLEGQGAVGLMQLSLSTWDGTSFGNGRFRTSAGGHLAQIDFYPHILGALGGDAEEIIRSSIRGGIANGYPILELDPPFRWATDEELPLQMGVQFETFEVRRGCSELAVACSPDRVIQVIPVDRLYAPAAEWPEDVEVRVTSN